MKILHYKTTMCLEEGGVVKAVLDLCAMSQTDDQVGIATFDPTGLPQEWLDPETTTTRLHHLNGTLGPVSKLNGAQKNELESVIEQYDIVHIHSIWSLSNPQVAAICKKLGKPYILSVHGMLDDWCMSQRKPKKLLYLKTWGRKLLPDAAAIHTTAQAELDQSCAWFSRDKGHVIPLPFDLNDYKDMPDPQLAYDAFSELNPDLPKVLFLSRIHYKKGVDRLIKASALLNKMDVKHQLVIAGTGDEPYVQEMKQLAQSQGITGHTYFLGFASGKEKIALFNACDIFTLPTSQENFGFVFFEALAAATTVLTTKGTDTWPEIESSGGGVIADNTPEAFAQALKEILSDLPSYKNNAKAAREWTFEQMAPDRVRNNYRTMYQSCIEKSEAKV